MTTKSRSEQAALALWKSYSAIRAHFDKEAWLIGAAGIIRMVYSSEPEHIAAALNEGDGTYKL